MTTTTTHAATTTKKHADKCLLTEPRTRRLLLHLSVAALHRVEVQLGLRGAEKGEEKDWASLLKWEGDSESRLSNIGLMGLLMAWCGGLLESTDHPSRCQ